MSKQTFQPKTRRGRLKHGFLGRMSTKAGRHLLRRRMAKNRHRLTV